jgi:transposase
MHTGNERLREVLASYADRSGPQRSGCCTGNDCSDAEAICEAVVRPNMRFVSTKTIEQQSGLVLHRMRSLLIPQQTSVINAIRGHLAAKYLGE